MSSVGLVLGGGFITGAAYQMAALMTIKATSGWDATDAELIVGTSAGAFVTSLVRGGRMGLDALIGPSKTRDDVGEYIAKRVFVRRFGGSFSRWFRHGLLPGLRKPGLTMLFGAPAFYDARGVTEWVQDEIGELAYRWPDRPTCIVTYDIELRRRVALGTLGAPRVALADAVSASSAVPFIFRPYEIDGRLYVDGGVSSGTHADLVLGHPQPLDLVLVLAPIAMEYPRVGATKIEELFDEAGKSSLLREVRTIRHHWPKADVLVLRPPPQALEVMRPRPMKVTAAVPSFVRTLLWMRTTLSQPENWEIFRRHFDAPKLPLTYAELPERLKAMR